MRATCVLVLWIALTGCGMPSLPPREPGFVDVSETVGLEELSGEYGALWADLTGDEWLDLVYLNHGIPSLYINQRGERFVNQVRDSGLQLDQWTYPQQDDRHGGSCADYDNDGDVDLFITHGAKRGETLGIKSDELLNNLGDAKFRDVTSHAGVHNRQGRGRLGTWADYDNDGWLDLLVGNFESPNVLYRNNRNGTFTDVTLETKIRSKGARTAWSDYDLDGSADVLITWPLKLYRNSGQGTFVDVSRQAGLAEFPPGLLPYSLAWGDSDGDGAPDLFLASSNEHNALYLSRRGGFQRSGSGFGLEAGERGGGAVWGDVDNDGDLDLFLASSHRLRLYLNLEPDSFAEPISLFEQDPPLDSGGEIALGDYDEDGFLDVALNSSSRHVLLRNTRTKNSWVKIILEGRASNRQAFGAKVWVEPESFWWRRVRYREYWGDTGVFRSVGCGPLHFGLGEARRFNLRIRWPSGRETSMRAVPANQSLKVSEP